MLTLLPRTLPPCLAALLVAVSDALAADAPPKPLSVTASLSYINTTGNSEVQTLLVTDKLDWRNGKWLFTQEGETLRGTDAGVENAARYFLSLRADREVSERMALYGLASWLRDVFGGVDRQLDQGVGLVFHAIVPNPQLLDLEVGAGLLQREDTAGQDESLRTGRLGAVYRYNFKEKTYFEAEGVYLPNLENWDDYERDAKLSLVAPLSNIFAMQLSYDYDFRNLPPAGIKQWDSTFSAGIQAVW